MKMSIITGLGIGLTLVFACLFIALLAELYYLLWWKNRGSFFSLLRRKRPTSAAHGRDIDTKDPDANSAEEQDPELESGKDSIFKSFGEQEPELESGKDSIFKSFGEESIESELKRLHNLAGPPRFLFTIKEETDLEAESGVRSRARSLSDIVLTSPMNSSPSLLGSFNPLFESSETELAGKSSPEPTFKFLRDAEEKLRFKEAKRVSENGGLVPFGEDFEAEDDTFVSIIVSKNNDRVLDA